MAKQISFGVWDYVVIAIVLAISSIIGIYFRCTGGKQKTTKEFLLADKNMSITPVAFSLMASFMSAITLLGVSSENYSFGVQFIVINISYGIFTFIAAYLYLPVFFKLQATSAYEYLEKRFGKTARLAASLSYTLQMTLYMGVVLYAPALVLEALTGITKITAILSVGVVCTFYSTLGGMKAVLITDVFQSLLMFVAIFSVIIYGWIDEGSLAEIWRIAEEYNRTTLSNFDPDPTERHSWFTLIIGGGVTYLSLYGVNQTQVQRYLTVKDLKTAQKALWLNWPILTCLSLSTSFSGLVIFSRYYNCDPITTQQIGSADQLLPYYVVDTMGHIPGLSGLFVAGIFSASLSTISAALNSLAAITVEDYIKPLYFSMRKIHLTETVVAVQLKVISLIFGGICLAVAFLAQFLGGLLQAALTIFGVVGGPLLGLFSLGMFTTVANETGSVCGLVAGVGFALWMALGAKPAVPLPRSIQGCENADALLNATLIAVSKKPEKTYLWIHRVSYLYNGVFGLVITFVIGIVLSFVINRYSTQTKIHDPNLFIPPLARKLRKKYGETINLANMDLAVSNSREYLKNGHKAEFI
ncbi:putative sodium-dependent multivitamin transporter isoform X2 [Diorhabda carinulata]|uniref:putative sodium-dependent multivitamin transporter isoform X2 n=1 Tax=Diorhabda carinulata TaxID=1163345 RepID=UPI0025A2E208|nr:putative sodium-dependent multivitamin transporter isoform X2 [Diorhabda carinulata]XP_057657309.1 putative sodium-dependent multivitamin transporter isoform X2 [Diorhabda carinulata]